MNNKCFSENLRRLRLEKGLTQDQLANTLGVSVQSVSRWECGNTLPDVMLLPEIARLYGVTVDDLYREEARAYANYAQRMVSVYEASGRTEDFLAAEQEFFRMPFDTLTADDLRSWGVLYHYMVQYCISNAQRRLEQAMEHPNASEDVYCSAAQQKIALMYDIGKGKEAAEQYSRQLADNPTDPRLWLLCTAAHHMIGENDTALKTALSGIERFPKSDLLHYYAGEIAREQKRYDDAFSYWSKALELDSSLMAATYSMGFCYEELGQFDKAYQVWTSLTEELDRKGFVIERKYPAELAEKCLKKMN